MDIMNFQGITKCSFNNGEGCRVVLWVSGCSHGCDGCHNHDFQNPNSGKLFTFNDMNDLLEYVKKPYIDGLTLSGGDPMFFQNRHTVNDIARIVKLSTHKSIWMYTGYLFEDIQTEPILTYLDVIVDGKYEKDKSAIMWAGSDNQRIWRKIDKKWRCDK